jgi:hypothetical protein
LQVFFFFEKVKIAKLLQAAFLFIFENIHILSFYEDKERIRKNYNVAKKNNGGGIRKWQ